MLFSNMLRKAACDLELSLLLGLLEKSTKGVAFVMVDVLYGV